MSTDESYSKSFCDERYGHVARSIAALEVRVKIVENRFLAMVSLLIANLLGVTVTLIFILLKFK